MDGGFGSSMAGAARRLVLWCARPAALEAGSGESLELCGRDLTALMLRRRGGGVRLVILRPPRAALPAARACSALGARESLGVGR